MNVNNVGNGQTGSLLSNGSSQVADNPFLKVLVTQLQSQTPLQPVDDNSFMQQMSTLSSMQQQQQLNDNLLQLVQVQGTLARMQGLSEGSSLLGKQITYDPGDGTQVTGTADSVFVANDGQVHIMVDGTDITSQQIIGIAASNN